MSAPNALYSPSTLAVVVSLNILSMTSVGLAGEVVGTQPRVAVRQLGPTTQPLLAMAVATSMGTILNEVPQPVVNTAVVVAQPSKQTNSSFLVWRRKLPRASVPPVARAVEEEPIDWAVHAGSPPARKHGKLRMRLVPGGRLKPPKIDDSGL